jgi:hypothetical protein
MKRLFQIFVIGALVALLATLASAQVPRMINYQGKLTTSAGAPVNDTLQMVFSIYADSGGTNLLWTETQPAVIVEKGVFNVLLGSVDSIPYSVFDGSIGYLGVKVGEDPEITPRKKMVSVAYAYRAGEGGGWIDAGTVVRLTTSTDSVGIGTTTPQAKLHVAGRTIKHNNYVITADERDQDGDGLAGSYFIDPIGIEGNAIVAFGFNPDNSAYLNYDDGFRKVIFGGTNIRVGIGTERPQRILHISDVMRLEPRGSAPANPSEGDIYVRSTDHHIYCYLNGFWKQLDN